MVKVIRTIENLDCQEETDSKGIYTFLERWPTAADSDHREQIFVYKPQGWPEVLQPQYLHSPVHILAKEGYWSRMKWDRLKGCSYSHPNWRSRLLFTHWKPIHKPLEGFLFETDTEINPELPDGLEWDTIDWSPVVQIVERARDLMQAGCHADRAKVSETHQQLKQWLDVDDPFFLNQWLVNFRMHGWILDVQGGVCT